MWSYAGWRGANCMLRPAQSVRKPPGSMMVNLMPRVEGSVSEEGVGRERWSFQGWIGRQRE